MATYDCIVLGTGGVGSAALYQLAARGLSVLGLDRFGPGHDRGSSHGQTRIIRQAYFEHADYVPLVLRSYELWRELEQRRGEQLFVQAGLLEVGPSQGVVVPGVKYAAAKYNLSIDELSAREIMSRWPGFRVDDDMSGVFEREAGYLHVERCVIAHLEEAQRLGATLETGVRVREWKADGGDAITVETDRGSFSAGRLIVTPGAWAPQLLAGLGLRLEVRRKPLFWYECPDEYHVNSGFPGYLFEMPEGIFYGFPQIDEQGIKIAEHTAGDIVTDPLLVDRELHDRDQKMVEMFLERHLPHVSRNLQEHAVCMYTCTPDEQFIVDRHPQHPQVAFAAGLSGHGFKFTPALGQALVELAIDGRTELPIEFLSASRPELASS